MTFVEAHRHDQRAVGHRLTRRGAPCPASASRSVAGHPPGPKAGRWPLSHRAPAGDGSSSPYGLRAPSRGRSPRSEEHTSELQSPCNLVCRLLLEKKKKKSKQPSVLVHHAL